MSAKTSRNIIKRKNLHNTTVLVDEILRGNEKVIDKNVTNMVKMMRSHMNKLSSLMSTPGPEKRPVFTKIHEKEFIDSTGIKFDSVTKAIRKCDLIDEKFVTQNNEFYILISILIAYHYKKKSVINKNSLGKILTLYLALRIYKAAFGAFFRSYEPNPEVMAYTIENLNSNRFNIKKYKTIFNTINYIAESHYENFEDILQNPIDDNIVYYITNIYSRIKLMLRTISNLYYENHEKGKKLGTDTLQSENDEGETYLNEVENISTLITINSRKIYLSFISDSVANPRILKHVCKITKVSLSKMTMTINKMLESRDTLLETLIIKMLSYYYSNGGTTIKSTKFIKQMFDCFAVSNTADKLVLEIKDVLHQLMTKYSKSYLETNNVGQLSNLKKTLFLYITLYTVDTL